MQKDGIMMVVRQKAKTKMNNRKKKHPTPVADHWASVDRHPSGLR